LFPKKTTAIREPILCGLSENIDKNVSKKIYKSVGFASDIEPVFEIKVKPVNVLTFTDCFPFVYLNKTVFHQIRQSVEK